MNYFIVIPTYNEKENIEKLLRDIESEFKANNISGGIIVVDDNSPDGTHKIVETLKFSLNDNSFRIELIKRSGKLGLGSAYIAGFKKALTLKADYIQEMDADFSHQPKYIKDFYKEIQTNDMVIGSRYISGGGVVNWNILRKLISKAGTLYATLLLGWKIKDTTAGFVCYRRKILEKINLDDVKSNGYVFQIEMKYRAFKKGFKLKEMPIIFPDRISGKSKMGISIVLEALINVVKLRQIN